MKHQPLTELLRAYRSNKMRYAYLSSTLEMLERHLAICRGEMIEDQVSMSQALTGMPHGSSVGDPVGRLALDIASGEVSIFVKQVEDEIRETNQERRKLEMEIRLAELALAALNDREQTLVEMKMVDDCSWAEICAGMSRKYGKDCSKRSLQRLLKEAMDKARKVIA